MTTSFVSPDTERNLKRTGNVNVAYLSPLGMRAATAKIFSSTEYPVITDETARKNAGEND